MGPHSTPALRWWAPAGTGTPNATEYSSGVRSGAAIAKIQGVRVVLVPGNDILESSPNVLRQPVLRIFRYHPCSSSYDPATTIAPTLMRIELAAADYDYNASAERVYSVPLVLPNDKVVIQTTRRIRCYDLSSASVFNPNDCELQSAPAPLWSFAGTTGNFLISRGASPAIGRKKLNDSTEYIFAVGQRQNESQLVALNPNTASGGNPLTWSISIGGSTTDIRSCPAIGPIIGTDESRNFVYVSKYNGGDPELYAVFSDNTGSPTPHTAEIDLLFDTYGSPRDPNGSFGSVAVHSDNGNLAVCSDDYGFYSFDNLTHSSNQLQYRGTTPIDSGSFISMTPGLFPDRHAIFWNEAASLRRVLDTGTGQEEAGAFDLTIGKGWEWGAPALDMAGRIYVNTVGTSGDDHGQRVLAFENRTVENQILQAWASNVFTPPTITIGSDTYALKQDFESPIAMDEDGTLICTNNGFVLALRPLLGDLNGDGCVNECDVDAFVTALVDPEEYDGTLGEGFGAVNRLGVCDCNNDGVCDNFDIDCFEALAETPVECSDGYEEQECEGEGDGFAGPSQGSTWQHFYETLDALRNYFGM
ncbi:MAG: hypothetical protein JNG88_17645 [Phycisphaerales bacterium]|nr:hypothetical protein [Phycisphaerales bacterium]